MNQEKIGLNLKITYDELVTLQLVLAYGIDNIKMVEGERMFLHNLVMKLQDKRTGVK